MRDWWYARPRFEDPTQRRCTCAKRSSQAWLWQPWPHWSSRSPPAAVRPHRPPPRRFPAARRTSSACSRADTLTIGADNPAYPPWFGGDEKTKPWKVTDPYSGKGYESAVAYAIAKQLGFTKAQVKWTVDAVQQLVPPGQEAVRRLPDAGVVQPGAREGSRLLEELLLRQPVARRAEGHADRVGEVDRCAEELQARRPDRDDERRLHQERDQAQLEPHATTRTIRRCRRSRAS